MSITSTPTSHQNAAGDVATRPIPEADPAETGEPLHRPSATTTTATTTTTTAAPGRRARHADTRPRRSPSRKKLRLGLLALAVSGTAAITAAVLVGDDGSSSSATPERLVQDREAVTRDLVNRGLIPRQTLEPAGRGVSDREAVTRDLVNRGLIPRQTLDPAVPDWVAPDGLRRR